MRLHIQALNHNWQSLESLTSLCLIIWYLKWTLSARKIQAWMQENRDWQNRGSEVEGRGRAVIVRGKMVWQQLIRLAKLWLFNEDPPLWQSSYYAFNHERKLIRFSIASLRRNQIKEQIIRQGRREEGKLKTLWGSFIHVWTLWITGSFPLIHEYLSTRKCVSIFSTQSVLGRLSFCLCVFATEGSLQDLRVI